MRWALLLSLLAGCGGGHDDPGPLAAWTAPPTPWLASDGAHIVDEGGRIVLLRGVNARVEGIFDVTFDDGRAPLEPIPPFGAEDAERMRALGLDVLRLPIDWSAIEPTEGVYDDAYLDRVAGVIALCAAQRIHVIVDFHQDAYSKEIGEDGAPLWAIHPAPDMLLEGPLDDLDARRLSPQVQRAFEGFFVDDDADDADVRLQQAFYAMARHVAERFADEPWVVGYDLYNEPVTGDRYVWRFHEGLTAAIREVDTRHLTFFEPSAVRNLTERAETPRAPFADPGGVYAPHLYTLSFGDPRGELPTVTRERLAPNVTRAGAEADAWRAPLFAGEWGVDPNAEGAIRYVGIMLDLFDEDVVGSTFWVWKERSQGSWGLFDWDEPSSAWTERAAITGVLSRPRFTRIAGSDPHASFDAGARALELGFEGRHDLATHQVYAPSVLRATCDGSEITPSERDPATGTFELLCAGRGAHVLRVEVGS